MKHSKKRQTRIKPSQIPVLIALLILIAVMAILLIVALSAGNDPEDPGSQPAQTTDTAATDTTTADTAAPTATTTTTAAPTTTTTKAPSSATAPTTTAVTTAASLPDDRIRVPLICQYPDLPTGCESTAAAMVLQYWGESVTAPEFARDWLYCSQAYYKKDGVAYGPDPHQAFCGDPFSKYAYGCYSTPIVQAINSHGTVCRAREITGQPLSALCREYLDNGSPLLIWATMNMKETAVGETWITPDGKPFTWIRGEHCLALVGYDDRAYYFNDPLTGKTVGYDKAVVEQRYAALGSQAVYIYKE